MAAADGKSLPAASLRVTVWFEVLESPASLKKTNACPEGESSIMSTAGKDWWVRPFKRTWTEVMVPERPLTVLFDG
jgi:hypothetical protein